MKKGLVVFLLVGLSAFTTHGKPVSHHALLLLSYHPSFPMVARQIMGVRKGLRSSTIQLDIEYMDSKRFYTAADIAYFKKFFLHKIKRHPKYNLIITADDNALRFILDIRKTVFPGVPVVFFGVNDRKLAFRMNSVRDVTGIVEAVSMKGTLRLIRKIHGKRPVHVFADSTPSGQSHLALCRSIASRIPGMRLRVLDLSLMSWRDFSTKLAAIPGDDPALLLSAFRDRTGSGKEFTESLRVIKNHFRGPLYILWRFCMGSDFIGGIVIDQRIQGETAARMALRILGGTPPNKIPVLGISPNIPVFDFREVKRLGIDPAVFPKDTVWIGKDKTFLDRYGPVLVPVLVLAGIFVLLSLALLVSHLKNRKTEIMLREERNLYQVYINSAPLGIISVDRKMRIILFNPLAEAMLECDAATVRGRSLQSLPLETAVINRFEQKLLQRSTSSLEFRRTGSDGRESIFSLKLQVLENGGGILFLNDITRRFEAGTMILEALREKELLVREIHHRVKNNMQIITSLMYMQAEHLSEESISCMESTISRIKTISTVHEKLINSQDRSRISLHDLIYDITYKQFWSNPGLSKRVQVVLEVAQLYSGIDTAIPLALILNELTDNAINYAFPGTASGMLRVSMMMMDGTVYLEVQDTGSGTPEAIQEESTGMKVVRILSAQLKGKLSFPAAKGLLIRVEFPGGGIITEEEADTTRNENGISEDLQGDIELFMGKEE